MLMLAGTGAGSGSAERAAAAGGGAVGAAAEDALSARVNDLDVRRRRSTAVYRLTLILNLAPPPPPFSCPPHFPAQVLVNTLLWRHMAPTAPDTLPCYPFSDADPFVIGGSGGGVSERPVPDIFFSGGARGLGTRIVRDGARSVRVVCVPDFSVTSTAVLVDLDSADYDVSPITFSAGAPPALRVL